MNIAYSLMNIFSVLATKIRKDLDFTEENLDTENPQKMLSKKNCLSGKNTPFVYLTPNVSPEKIYIQVILYRLINQHLRI